MSNGLHVMPAFGGFCCGRTASGTAWRARGLRLLRCTALAALVMVLLACSEAPAPPLLVGINTRIGYDPLVLARDRGLADPQQVKVVELISSAEALRHLRNGLLDAAGLTMGEALRLVDSGFDARIVAVLDTSAGADVVLVAPHIHDLSGLRGARIVVEDATVGTLMLDRLLDQAGLRREQVTVLRLDATQHLTALQSGRVAAAVSYAPINEPMQREGFRPIFDSQAMPGEIVDVLVVRTEVLRNRPKAVDALMASWATGLAALQQDPIGAAAALAPGAGLTPAQYEAVQKGLRFYTPVESLQLLSGDPPRLAQQSLAVTQLLMEPGVLKAAPRWADLIDTAPARRAPHPRGRP